MCGTLIRNPRSTNRVCAQYHRNVEMSGNELLLASDLRVPAPRKLDTTALIHGAKRRAVAKRRVRSTQVAARLLVLDFATGKLAIVLAPNCRIIPSSSAAYRRRGRIAPDKRALPARTTEASPLKSSSQLSLLSLRLRTIMSKMQYSVGSPRRLISGSAAVVLTRSSNAHD